MIARAARRIIAQLPVAYALLAPPALALAVFVLSGRGSSIPLWLPSALAAIALALALRIARRHRIFSILYTLEALALCAFIATYFPSPFPPGPAYAGSLPLASPPPTMRAYRIPTGAIHRTAAFGYRGGAFSSPREFTMTSVLLRHPKGDLLLDTGFGTRVAEHFASLPFIFRLATSYEVTRPVADQLTAAHYAPSRLRAVLLTHAHWDHASGLADLRGAPVLVPRAELHFIAHSGFLGEAARTSGARFETYTFDSGPYLGFPASHDLHGDGSVVVVPAPGHTPGSVIVFVTLPGERRYAFIGDLAWQLEGVTEREERPWITRTFGDADPAAVRENLQRMAALHARFPSLRLVPAHDPRGFASLEALPTSLE